jgi:hypothetical protein
MSLDSVRWDAGSGANRTRAKPTPTPVWQGAESVNHELIFRQISPLGDLATQSMTPSSYEKSGCTLMPNSNDVAGNEMLWERVLSLLVVGASMLGGSRFADTGVTANTPWVP